MPELSESDCEDFLERLALEWSSAPLDPVDRALCAYADKLTRTPAAMSEADVLSLRDVGLQDELIHDAIQVVSYFNYINRIADAVHVDLDPGMAPYPEPDSA